MTGHLHPRQRPPCYNRPDYKRGREVQDGWTKDGKARIVWLEHRMTTDCVQNEPGGAALYFGWNCAGCRHYNEEDRT